MNDSLRYIHQHDGYGNLVPDSVYEKVTTLEEFIALDPNLDHNYLRHYEFFRDYITQEYQMTPQEVVALYKRKDALNAILAFNGSRKLMQCMEFEINKYA